MSKRLKQATLVLVILFVFAQFIRPNRADPVTSIDRSFQAQTGTPVELSDILARSCGDCHSNHSVWPWYTHIAPLSWLMAYGVREGRRAVNFSEWGTYAPARQRGLMRAACHDVSTGKMPGAYTLLHPAMKLSSAEVKAICAAAR